MRIWLLHAARDLGTRTSRLIGAVRAVRSAVVDLACLDANSIRARELIGTTLRARRSGAENRSIPCSIWLTDVVPITTPSDTREARMARRLALCAKGRQASEHTRAVKIRILHCEIRALDPLAVRAVEAEFTTLAECGAALALEHSVWCCSWLIAMGLGLASLSGRRRRWGGRHRWWVQRLCHRTRAGEAHEAAINLGI